MVIRLVPSVATFAAGHNDGHHGCTIGARSGVVRDVKPGERILGAPAGPEAEAKRILLSLERLPDVVRDVRAIKKQLGMQDDQRKAS